MGEFGFLCTDYTDDDVEVWAEHWQAVQLFIQMGTQWRTGFGGAIGLDYSVLAQLMDWQQIEPSERNMIFEQIRVMESTALNVMYEERD